jgi:hypothetical protein
MTARHSCEVPSPSLTIDHASALFELFRSAARVPGFSVLGAGKGCHASIRCDTLSALHSGQVPPQCGVYRRDHLCQLATNHHNSRRITTIRTMRKLAKDPAWPLVPTEANTSTNVDQATATSRMPEIIICTTAQFIRSNSTRIACGGSCGI